MKKVDYIRNCVEERVGHIGNKVYNTAIDMANSSRCVSMADRINAIVVNVRHAKKIVLGE